MRVFTGPGKVKDDRDNPSSAKTGISAALFNFDIDDATVKLEHQLWLETHALPVLLTSRNTRVALKGLASRSGSQSHNLQLSDKRVTAVRQFMLGRGVMGGQMSSDFRGEDEAALLGVKDGIESEEFRAVSLKLQPPSRIAQVRFERPNPANRADGFDDTGFTPWLMVPAFGFRKLLFVLNAEGMTLATDNPGVARPVSPVTNTGVEEMVLGSDRELIRIEGGMPGEANLFVRELSGREVAKLEISVLIHKEAAVVFHFVHDSKNKPKRGPGEENELLRVVNQFWEPQANVTFVKKSSQTLPFTQDLSDPAITTKPTVTKKTIGKAGGGKKDFHVLTEKGDKSGRIAVFFVWEYEVSATSTGDTNAEVDDIPGVAAVVEDEIGTFTLAHEFGHCLGLEHNEAATDLVMFPIGKSRTGARLLKGEILKAHRHVESINPK